MDISPVFEDNFLLWELFCFLDRKYLYTKKRLLDILVVYGRLSVVICVYNSS